jgi:hypothetical protein
MMEATMAISIESSVGLNGTNNPNDILAVKSRMVELGFNFIQADGEMGPSTIKAIRLFQAITNGVNIIDKPQNDGRVDAHGNAIKWLQAVNAPRWTQMPAGSTAQGFVNDNIADIADKHDFGTDWLAETLSAAAATYKANHLASHPGAALLHINDTSLPQGGDTQAHKEHEAGLQSDIRLPHRDGSVGGITVFANGIYDRDAMRAMIKAFRQQELASEVFLNDTVLISEGLCHHADGHDNHAHFEIKPPARVMPD